MEPLTKSEYELLAILSEDVHGLYGIPMHCILEVLPGHAFENEVPPSIRSELEKKMARTYERFFENGWIDVYRVSADQDDQKLDQSAGTDELRKLKNYDYTNVGSVYIGVMTSVEGRKILDSMKEHYYRNK
jgi:hypothetical protein